MADLQVQPSRPVMHMTGARRLWPMLAVAIVVVALGLDLWNHPEEIGVDFHTYEAAARVGLQQGWSHIYDQALVAAEQKDLVPGQRSQPYLSPPPVAWLAAALASIPYGLAFYVWALATLAAYAVALAWSAPSHGPARWIGMAAVTASWWVPGAIRVGQVVPFVAASVLVAWRLVREEHDWAAGVVLSLVLLKPNTAILVPFALLAAGRYRTFATWSACGIALAAAAMLTVGTDGLGTYVSELTGHLPRGASALTLEGAFGITGGGALAFRAVIVAATLVTAFKLRRSPGLVIAAGTLGSLLASPYLHASDLCLFSAAAWIVWEERRQPAWRAPLAIGWVLASPYVLLSGIGPSLNRWPLIELVLLLALVVVAWRPLTRGADLRTPAPA